MMSVTCVLCVSLLIYHYISAAGIGSTCTSNMGCRAVANAVCKNTICTCPENFVQSASNNKCIRSRKHSEDCEESVQCNYSHEMECKDNKCQCKANFKYDGVECLGSLGLGQKCERDSECFDSSDLKQKTVWCFGQQCACRSGFTGEGPRCVIGGDCVTDSDCNHLENSACKKMLHDRYRCTCQDKYLAAANNTKCLPRNMAVTGGSGSNKLTSTVEQLPSFHEEENLLVLLLSEKVALPVTQRVMTCVTTISTFLLIVNRRCCYSI